MKQDDSLIYDNIHIFVGRGVYQDKRANVQGLVEETGR